MSKEVTVLKKLADCEHCDNTGFQIQNEGVMLGMIRPCPHCANSLKTYENQYGTDVEEQPDTFIDTTDPTNPIVQRIDKTKDYLLLPNGQEIDLNTI